jgi:ankyrin repeat protein
VELIQILIRAGATVERDDRTDGFTAVHAAAENGHVDVLTLLMEAGGQSVLGVFDYVDRTPLICAVDKKHLEAAMLLIRAGSDINANNEPRIGDTALHQAARNGDVKMVRLLLDEGADPTIPGWTQLTPADVASGRQADKLRRLMGKARQRRS